MRLIVTGKLEEDLKRPGGDRDRDFANIPRYELRVLVQLTQFTKTLLPPDAKLSNQM